MVRRTKIKFLPTTFCFLGVFPEICPQKGAQSAIWSALRASQLGSEHRCADTVDFFPSWPFPLLFAQQPLHRTIRPGKDITRSVRAKGALTSPLMRSHALHSMVKEEHCDRNSLLSARLSVDTDDGAAHGAQSAQDGPATTQ